VRYFLARTVQAILLMLGVSLLSFAFLELAPGDFFEEIRLNPQISRETVASLRKQYGLDQSLPTRYLLWLRSVSRGEFGFSFAYDIPVASLLWIRARNTLLLASIATLVAWLIAVPLGVLSANSPNGWVERTCAVSTSTLLATPDLLIALVLLLLAVRSGWFQVGGMTSADSDSASTWKNTYDIASHLVLPVTALVLGNLCVLFRHTESAMREVLRSPFIAAARAHGIGRIRILFRHALPAALNPLASLFGISFGGLLSASLLVEVVLNWPGLGPLLLEALVNRDVYVVIGTVMLSAVFLVTGMFAADLLLFAADPRIRTERLA